MRPPTYTHTYICNYITGKIFTLYCYPIADSGANNKTKLVLDIRILSRILIYRWGSSIGGRALVSKTSYSGSTPNSPARQYVYRTGVTVPNILIEDHSFITMRDSP